MNKEILQRIFHEHHFQKMWREFLAIGENIDFFFNCGGFCFIVIGVYFITITLKKGNGL